MSVSAHIAAQRTDHAVPHAVSCRALGVAASTFYKWRDRPPTPARRRRAELDAEVKACFDASGGTYGSPRVRAALRRSGLKASKKTVEASMARQGLQGRARRRRRGLTRPDKRAEPVPDLLRRDFTADGVNEKWVGDFKQIDTGEGPVFLATVEDLFSRRMTGETMPDPDGVLPVGLEAARARAWAEDQRRCGDNEPYTDGVTAEALIERVEGQHRTHSRPRPSGQDYAFAVSSDEGPPLADGASSDGGRQLSWVAVLPECDRRLFAEEMSRLMAEAAETDDLAPVERALREWRVTAEIYSDPELAQRFTGPLALIVHGLGPGWGD